MKEIILLFVCALLPHVLWAGDDPKYAISDMNKLLLLGEVNSVVRQNTEVLTIDNERRAKKERKMAITLFNDKAHSEIYIYHNKFNKVNDIMAAIYDQDGRLIRRLKDKEIEDVQAETDALAADHYYYRFNLLHADYPYTLEYSYTVSYNGFMDFTWSPYITEEQSVENAKYVVSYNQKNDIRYFASNINEKPQITLEGENQQWTWVFKNQFPAKREVLSGSYEQYWPAVTIIPQNFSLDGFEGSNASWQSFGQWIGKLWDGLDELSPAAQAEIQQLVRPDMNEYEKIAAIYRYVQQHNRYVSIQLGIGGFKPFSAEFVHKNKYGDCKALTNYTKAALKTVGIEAIPSLISVKEIEQKVLNENPHNHFDHVILCVPTTQKDTVWLECTSNELPPSLLYDSRSFHCAAKTVLLITPEGGKLAKTPPNLYKNNRLHTKAQLQLSDDGRLNAQINFNAIGLEKINLNQLVALKSNKDIALGLQKSRDMPNIIVLGSNFAQIERQRDTLQAYIECQVVKKNNMAAKRVFVNMAILSVGDQYILPTLEKGSKRNSDIYLFDAFDNMLEITLPISAGWNIESMPEKVSLKTIFGTYEQEYRYDETGKKVILTAHMSIQQPIIEAAQYTELKDFYDKIANSRQQMLVLVKE